MARIAFRSHGNCRNSQRECRKYFEEAHQCFLYGFPTATAMLCRAILDTCLTELLDPDKQLKQELERSDARKRPSYLKELIRKAA